MTLRWAHRLTWLALACATLACQSVLGIEDTTAESGNADASSGGTDSGSGGTGGADSGSGGSGGSAGTAGAGAGDAGIELCDNGVDDDSDTKIDCADSDCTGFECSLPLPLGFEGPAVYATGATGSVASCTGAYATEVFAGNSGLTCEKAGCSCDCGSNLSSTCPLPYVFLSAGNCPGDGQQLNLTSGCTTLPFSPAKVSGPIVQKTPTGGSCTPSGGAPQKPAPVWDIQGRLCEPSALSGGCASNLSCLPPAPSGFEGPCVYGTGDMPCPSSGYTEKHLIYGDVDDQRGCSACTCTGNVGGTCSNSIYFYKSNLCVTGADAYVNPFDSCKTVTSGLTRAGYQTTPTGYGTCNANVTSIGSCTEKDPVTVCCAP